MFFAVRNKLGCRYFASLLSGRGKKFRTQGGKILLRMTCFLSHFGVFIAFEISCAWILLLNFPVFRYLSGTYLCSMILSRFSMPCGFVVPFSLIALRRKIDPGNSCLVSCALSIFRLSVGEMWAKMVQHITNNAKKRRLSLQAIVTCEYFMVDFE